MMYIHYCKNCNRIYMLNGHKLICPRCTEPLAELRISYLDYIDLNLEQRASFLKSCADESQPGSSSRHHTACPTGQR